MDFDENKSRDTESPSNINVVEIPEETATKKKRFDSPGYMLRHPEQTKKAVWWTITHNALAVTAFLIIAGYALAEVQSFIYLWSHYGFMK